MNISHYRLSLSPLVLQIYYQVGTRIFLFTCSYLRTVLVFASVCHSVRHSCKTYLSVQCREAGIKYYSQTETSSYGVYGVALYLHFHSYLTSSAPAHQLCCAQLILEQELKWSLHSTLIVLNLRNPNLRSACAMEHGNAQ